MQNMLEEHKKSDSLTFKLNLSIEKKIMNNKQWILSKRPVKKLSSNNFESG